MNTNARDSQKFSFSTIVITAVITFLISGIGGTALQSYISRAKPKLIVTSAGFQGGSDMIQLPSGLMEASRNDVWGDTFKNFVSFEALRSRDKHASRVEQRLNRALLAMEEWMEEYSEIESNLISERAIRNHPHFQYDIIGISINGQIRRTEFETPPITDHEQYELVFPVYERENGVIVHQGTQGTLFPNNRFLSSDQHDLNNLIAMSYGKCIKDNVFNITTQSIQFFRKELLLVKQLREQIQKSLIKNARIAVGITIHNSGNTALTLRPYFVVDVMENKDKIEKYVMTAQRDSDEELEDGDTSGEEVNPEEFLPTVGSTRYITIPPKENVTIELVAATPLKRPEHFKTMYESGLLPVRVLALTTEGGKVWSEISRFGKKLATRQKRIS